MTALDSQDGKYNAIGLQLPTYYEQTFPIQNRCANCHVEYSGNTNSKNIYCYRCKVSMSKVFNQVHILVPVSEIDEITLQKKELEKKKALEEWRVNELEELKKLEVKQIKIQLHKELEEERMIIKKYIRELKIDNALQKYRAFINKQKQEALVLSQPPKISPRVISKQEQLKLDLIEFINAPIEQRTLLFKSIIQKEIDSRKAFEDESNLLRNKMNPDMTDFSELDYMTKKFNIHLHLCRIKNLSNEQHKLKEQIIANELGMKYNSIITIEERRLMIAELQLYVAVDKLERDGKIY
jgi:hypothetical protein